MPQPLHPYRMAWSFKVGRLFGIDVKVHLIFLVIIAWLCLNVLFETGSLRATGWIFCQLVIVFTIVLMHELGHSLMAQRHGIRVIDITLWPLGGLARLEGNTEDPKTELKIATAGPAVNLALAALAYSVLYTAVPESQTGALYSFALFMMVINLLMGLFNLIPAFPMDGGRILRALLAGRLPYIRATEIAVKIGKYLVYACFLMILSNSLTGWFSNYPLLQFWLGDNSIWICIIGLFILWAGSTELRAARVKEYMKNAWKDGFGQEFSGQGIFGKDIFGKNPFGQGSSGPRGQQDDIIDAEVVSDKTQDQESNPQTPIDPQKLSDTEKQFIDFIKKYGKRPDGN